MKIFYSLAILLVSLFTHGQSLFLKADVLISMKEGVLIGNFEISGIHTTSAELKFLLHKDINVSGVKINEVSTLFEETSTSCYDCKEYVVRINKLSPDEVVFIATKMKFKNYPKGDKKDYKGKIISNFGILRASEQSKWYPVLITDQTTNTSTNVFQKTLYDYEIQVDCEDCNQIYVGQGLPNNTGTFRGEQPLDAIMLVAGNFDSKQTNRTYYINIKDDELVDHLDGLFCEITEYYQSLTGIKQPTNFVYAQLPSANKHWGGFMSYPTIVNVNAKVNRSKLPSYLSHEVAHYLFGDVFKPNSSLYWFYLESFAEYFSYKFMMTKNPDLLNADYKRLQGEINFVRLDQVKGIDEITGQHRYTTGAFQLLAIDHRIGEEKMILMIPLIFEKLELEMDGYQAFLTSMSEVGVSAAEIASIERDLIRSFDIDQYAFVDDLIRAKK